MMWASRMGAKASRMPVAQTGVLSPVWGTTRMTAFCSRGEASWEDMGTSAWPTSVLCPSLPSLFCSLAAWPTHTLPPFTDLLYFCREAFLQFPAESCSPISSNTFALCPECSRDTQGHSTWYSGNTELQVTQTYVLFTYEPFTVLSTRHNHS